MTFTGRVVQLQFNVLHKKKRSLGKPWCINICMYARPTFSLRVASVSLRAALQPRAAYGWCAVSVTGAPMPRYTLELLAFFHPFAKETPAAWPVSMVRSPCLPLPLPLPTAAMAGAEAPVGVLSMERADAA